MNIAIELRHQASPAGSEESLTFAKIELTDCPNLIPDSIQVNGKWFVRAEGTQAAVRASTWESLKP